MCMRETETERAHRFSEKKQLFVNRHVAHKVTYCGDFGGEICCFFGPQLAIVTFWPAIGDFGKNIPVILTQKNRERRELHNMAAIPDRPYKEEYSCNELINFAISQKRSISDAFF